MSVWDPVSQTSYVNDLGVTINSFLANANTPGYSLSYAASNLLTSNFNLAGNTSLVYNVAALDKVPTNAPYLGQVYLSTTNAAASVVASMSNSKVNNMQSSNGYVTTINGSDLNYATNNEGVFSAATGGAAYFGSGIGTNWLGYSTFNNAAAVGTAQNMWELTPSSNSGLGHATVSELAGQWNLSSAGNLTYAVPGAAPVPLPAAVWLLGSGLIGMVGVARRKSSKTAA
ncbi:MAG TPA: hypothetical protein DCQ77_00255 [Betaproteobacteria bacterium]|nr:hypothetical protein [Betaproteobacteria bacterium]